MVEEKLHRLEDLAKDQQDEERFDSAGGRICGTLVAGMSICQWCLEGKPAGQHVTEGHRGNCDDCHLLWSWFWRCIQEQPDALEIDALARQVRTCRYRSMFVFNQWKTFHRRSQALPAYNCGFKFKFVFEMALSDLTFREIDFPVPGEKSSPAYQQTHRLAFATWQTPEPGTCCAAGNATHLVCQWCLEIKPRSEYTMYSMDFRHCCNRCHLLWTQFWTALRAEADAERLYFEAREARKSRLRSMFLIHRWKTFQSSVDTTLTDSPRFHFREVGAQVGFERQDIL